MPSERDWQLRHRCHHSTSSNLNGRRRPPDGGPYPLRITPKGHGSAEIGCAGDGAVISHCRGLFEHAGWRSPKGYDVAHRMA